LDPGPELSGRYRQLDPTVRIRQPAQNAGGTDRTEAVRATHGTGPHQGNRLVRAGKPADCGIETARAGIAVPRLSGAGARLAWRTAAAAGSEPARQLHQPASAGSAPARESARQ